MSRLRTAGPRGLITGAALVAMTVGLVALGSPAQAEIVDYTSHCENRFSPNLPDGNLRMDLVVTPDKPVYAVGEEVSVTWKWDKYPKAPPTIPVIGEVPENSTHLEGTVRIGGAQQGDFEVVGPKTNPKTLPGEDLRIADGVGSFALSAPGTVELTPGDYSTWTHALGMDVATTCVPVAPVAVARTLVVEGAQQEDPTLVATPGEVAAGASIALTGSNWPNGTPTVALCAADGTACDPAAIASGNTLAVTAGALTGDVRTLGTVAGGDHTLRVQVGAASALAPIKIVAVGRQATLDPTRGPVGTTVAVTGDHFAPNSYIIAQGVTATGEVLDDTMAYAESLADGTFVIPDFVASDARIVAVRVTEGTDETTAVDVPFEIVTPGRELGQEITGRVVEGGLTISQEQPGVELSAVTLDGTDQHSTGAINTVTVKDTRVAGEGWTLTGKVGALTTPEGATIPADNLTWTPAVTTADPASHGVPTPGSPGPIGAGATLATMTNAPAGETTAGAYAADALLDLTVPAFQTPGAYSTTLTLSLS